MATINLTKGGFERRIASLETMQSGIWKFLGGKPAVIDFYAPWCGPCKMLSPVLEELSEEYSGKVDVYKVNVDDEEELAALWYKKCANVVLYPNGRESAESGRGLV